MTENNHDRLRETVQVMLPEWPVTAFPLQIVGSFIHDLTPSLDASAWWQRAYELAHTDSQCIDELITALTNAGATKEHAAVASNTALSSARCERFRIADDLMHSIAASQVAHMYAGFLAGMTGFTPEALEQAIKDDRSKSASKAATAKHAETRAMKEDVQDHYRKNKHSYKSKNAAAAAMAGKLVPLTFSTVRDYLRGI